MFSVAKEMEIYVGDMFQKMAKFMHIDHMMAHIICTIFGQGNYAEYNEIEVHMKHKHLWHMFKLNDQLKNASVK